MDCLNLIDNRFKLFFLGLIYRIIQIFSLYGLIRRNLDNVHGIDISKLLLLRLCGTGHSGLFLKFVKEVLESNGCQRSGLSFYLHMFLRFNRLMQSVGIPSSVHNTSGKFIDNQNLIILYDIIHIPLHKVVCPKSKDDIMLNLEVLRIGKVVNMKILFYFFYTLLRKVYRFFLFVNNKVSAFLNFLSQNSIDFGKLGGFLSSFELSCQNIAKFIELCRFSGLSGDDKRRSRFID